MRVVVSCLLVRTASRTETRWENDALNVGCNAGRADM